MRNEEVARICANDNSLGDSYDAAKAAALDMAEWKDQQHAKEVESLVGLAVKECKQVMIDKACGWLEEHWGDYYAPVEYRKLTDAFRKAMTEKTNPLFEKCLAKVNPDTRKEVRENMELTNLTWQDVRKIWEAGMVLADYNTYRNIPIEDEVFYNNILKQFQDGCKQV